MISRKSACLVTALALAGIGGLSCSFAEQADNIAECAGTPVPTISIEPSADGTPISFVPRRVRHPDFASWDELETYIAARHDRIRECAATAPDQVLVATVSFSRALTAGEVEVIVDEHDIALRAIEYTSGALSGQTTITPGLTLEDIENRIRTEVQYISFSAAATAVNWSTAIENEPAIALVYADHSLDRISGRIPQNVAIMPIPSIWEAYQRLQPPSD